MANKKTWLEVALNGGWTRALQPRIDAGLAGCDRDIGLTDVEGIVATLDDSQALCSERR